MAQIFEFSEEDLNRGRLITPGWYAVEITGAEPKQNKKGDGINIWMKGKILYEADNGSKEFAGMDTPLGFLFSDKAKGFAAGFFKALGGDVKAGARFDFDATIGKKIEMRINNETYEGKMVNSVPHEYRKAKE